MNADKRQQIFARLRDANPHPTTKLNYSSPLELLNGSSNHGAVAHQLGLLRHTNFRKSHIYH